VFLSSDFSVRISRGERAFLSSYSVRICRGEKMYSFCQILLFGFTDKGLVCVPFIRFCVDLCRGKQVCSFNEIQLN